MKFFKTPIEGLLVMEPDVFPDSRGLFFESYSEKDLAKNDVALKFVQDNQSHSSKHVLRGLHYQKKPFEQGKLVRVVKGSVWDVAVDIRPGSPTFGKYYADVLSAENHRMLWIPPGFAHGFLALEEDTIFLYKCTGYYNRDAESGIRYDDPSLAIPWNVTDPVVSEKDMALPLFDKINFSD